LFHEFDDGYGSIGRPPLASEQAVVLFLTRCVSFEVAQLSWYQPEAPARQQVMLLLWREVFASLALRVSVFSSVFLVRL